MHDDRRKHRRYRPPNMETTVTDGRTTLTVAVNDISKSGVSLADIPAEFDETVENCTAEIKSSQGDFTLELQPRWVHLNNKGGRKRIGFQIKDPTGEWLQFIEQLKKAGGSESKRKSRRYRTMGLMAMVSDGSSRCFGIVEDISEHGLRLTQIPGEFDDGSDSCSAVVHGPAGDVNISLRPCWVNATKKGMYKTIGFHIMNPPDDWQGLIQSLKDEVGQLDFLVPEEDENTPD